MTKTYTLYAKEETRETLAALRQRFPTKSISDIAAEGLNMLKQTSGEQRPALSEETADIYRRVRALNERVRRDYPLRTNKEADEATDRGTR